MEYENVEVNSERWLNLRNLLNEKWRDIKGYEGLYRVSNYGRIKSLPRNGTILKEKILKPNLNMKTQYFTIILSKNNVKKNLKIHRLVAEAFIPNPYNKSTVNHKDGNKLNNKIDNLEWNTIQENITHSIKTGLKPDDKGTNNIHSKFLKKDIEFIRKMYKKGDKKFGCRKLAQKFNVSKSTISYIINKKTYK